MKKKNNSYGNGSISFNKQRNNWIVIYFPQTNVRKTKTFNSFEDAEIFLKNLQFQKKDSIFIKHNGIPLNEIMKTILQIKYSMNKISDGQYNRLENEIKKLEKLSFVHKDINGITSNEIQNFFNSLINTYSNSTISKTRDLFNQAYTYAMNRGFLKSNPMYDVITPKSKKEDKKVEALEVEEQQKLCNYLLNCSIDELPYKNAFLIELFMGLRVGETLALKYTDVNLDKNLIYVNKTLTKNKKGQVIMGNSTKTYAGTRELPIPQYLKPYIIEQLKISKLTPNQLLFITPNGNYVLHSTLNHQLKNICKKIDIKKDISNHTLRHTYGTRCIESGMRAVALQRLMGHQDISVTLNTYTSVFNKYKEEELKKVNDYFINQNILDNNFNKEQSLYLDNEKDL